jgi:hypothetical protein
MHIFEFIKVEEDNVGYKDALEQAAAQYKADTTALQVATTILKLHECCMHTAFI